MIIPYLNMFARVTIGDIVFEDVSNITIQENVNTLSDTAVIVIPRFFKKLDGKSPLDYIKYGDNVTIEYGYEEVGMSKQYTGFVRYIASDAPLEITCDQLYPLRQNNHVMSFKSVSLKELLKAITKGTFISKIECPDVELGKYLINNSSTYQVLEKIKEEFGFFTRLYGTTLHVGWAWDWESGFTQRHVYDIQKNVKKSDGLVYQRKDAFNVRVRVKVRNSKGKVSYVESGSKQKEATVYTIDYASSSEEVAKKIADARLKKSVYDGYSGNITGFGHPVTRAGDSLQIINNREPFKSGVYLIEGVEKEYSQEGGISFKNTLAYKL